MTETLATGLDIDAVRARFSALQQGFAFLDAPGGSQVPDEVGEAIARALREASANPGAGYGTGRGAGEILGGGRRSRGRRAGGVPTSARATRRAGAWGRSWRRPSMTRRGSSAASPMR